MTRELKPETIELIENKYPSVSDGINERKVDAIVWALTNPKILTSANLYTEEQVREKMYGKWVSVGDRLPTKEDADENGNVLIWRETNYGQKSLSKSIYDYSMVKHLDKTAYWTTLPNPPNQ